MSSAVVGAVTSPNSTPPGEPPPSTRPMPRRQAIVALCLGFLFALVLVVAGLLLSRGESTPHHLALSVPASCPSPRVVPTALYVSVSPARATRTASHLLCSYDTDTYGLLIRIRFTHQTYAQFRVDRQHFENLGQPVKVLPHIGKAAYVTSTSGRVFKVRTLVGYAGGLTVLVETADLPVGVRAYLARTLMAR